MQPPLLLLWKAALESAAHALRSATDAGTIDRAECARLQARLGEQREFVARAA